MSDAIYHLRGVYDSLDGQSSISFFAVRGVLKDAIDEIERLQSQVAKYSPYSDGAMKAENERLRAALEFISKGGGTHTAAQLAGQARVVLNDQSS